MVGGDAAGMSAASQAKRLDPGLEIVAFERSGYASYSACGEPYHVAGLVDPIERLVARTPERFADFGIEVRIRHEVVEIDLGRRRVGVADLEAGGRFEVEWDHLMAAIRSDKPYNEAERGAMASAVTSMGRHACHTGRAITLDEYLKLDHEFAPQVDDLTLDGPAPLKADDKGKYPVPEPGKKTGREY